ncbi:hypothetical protein PRZ48_001690 [Zasmidium cellare]|uniref:BRCT domain-containing protein n=1 Tax=Zasmidium cellare TaxID=395010 RepID=A0ABR0F3H2_ZASCE|nr:hypothetical protein PRZ48_001690 [Zasmidium cellare]
MPPPLSSLADETRDPPRPKEDSETDVSDDDMDTSPTAKKAAGNTNTSATKDATNGDEADAAAPSSPVSKPMPSQANMGKDVASDAEVMAPTPRSRMKYGKKEALRRAKGAISSDSAGPTSSAVANEAAARSVSGSVVQEDDGDTDNKSTASNGKLPTVNKGKKRKGPPRPKSEEDTYGVSAEDDDPPPKKARLPKAAREEASDDEITVATRSVKKKAPQRSSGPASKAPSSTDSPAPTPLSFANTPSKAVITMCTPNGKVSGWFKKKLAVVEEVPTRRTNFVCVTRDKDLPTTAKILKTLVAGKPVLSVKWIIDSHREGTVLDPNDYKHPELPNNDESSEERRSLFKGKTLFFTNAAVNSYDRGWDAIKEVAQEAGAAAVSDGTATKGDRLTPKDNVLLFGNGDEDVGVHKLIKEHGRVVYDKAMFAQAIIRAELDLESDEFKLKGDSSGTKASGRAKR